MQPKIVLSRAWAEAEGMSDADLASLFDIDLAGAVLAGARDVCPRCGNNPADSAVQLFADEPAAATPEQVKIRVIVRCLCGATYWYPAVHEVNIEGHACVRGTSTTLTPATGTLETQGLEPVVVEKITVREAVAVSVGRASVAGRS